MATGFRTCICPVCGISVHQDQISHHVEQHFAPSPTSPDHGLHEGQVTAPGPGPGTSQGKDQKFMKKFFFLHAGLFAYQSGAWLKQLLFYARLLIVRVEDLPCAVTGRMIV